MLGSALATVAAGTVAVSPASAAHVACGAVITTNTVLDSNVGPCTVGITIGASNIVLDLGGFTVFGTPGNDDSGIIFANVTGSTVRNGTVRDFDTGVEIDRGSGNTVTAMDLRDNPRFDAIFVFRSDNTKITHNRMNGNGTFSQVTLEDSSNSQVTNNVIQGGVRGTTIGIWVLNNRDRPVAEGDPDLVGLQASNNLIAYNLVQGNALDGIQISRFATRNIVQNNDASQNGVLRTNNVRDGSGIIVFGNENTVQDNLMYGNGANGLFISASTSANTGRAQGVNNTLLRNRAFGNDTGTIVAPSFDLRDGNPNCDNNGWHGNQGQTFTPPCVLNP